MISSKVESKLHLLICVQVWIRAIATIHINVLGSINKRSCKKKKKKQAGLCRGFGCDSVSFPPQFSNNTIQCLEKKCCQSKEHPAKFKEFSLDCDKQENIACLPVYPVATSSKTFGTETVLKSNGCFGTLASAVVNICCWLSWMASCLSASSFNQSTFLTWEDSSPILIVTLWPFDPSTCPRVGLTVNVSPDSCFFSTLSDQEDVFSCLSFYWLIFWLFIVLTFLAPLYISACILFARGRLTDTGPPSVGQSVHQCVDVF